ncbi:MAG TPA: hypothetical protein VKC89_03355 [Patescibacteria group bacterium]|nr:hypothetical protein [Patescibacteria group bacterium]
MNEINLEPSGTWDVKKILIFIAIMAVVAFGFKTYVLDKNASITSKSKSTQVEGTSVKNSDNIPPNFSPSQELKQNLQTKLSDLKKEVNNINVVDIATSTPAVQKVLSDFKNLQNLPQSQAKQACVKICDGL